MVLADGETLRQVTAAGGFVPYVSEASDQVHELFHGPNDAYVGVWYDPMVIALNSDYCKSLKSLPLTWGNWKRFPQYQIGNDGFSGGVGVGGAFCVSFQYLRGGQYPCFFQTAPSPDNPVC